MSLLVDLGLGAALALASATVFRLHGRLTRLGADLATYRQAIGDSIVALEGARQALEIVVGEGRATAAALVARIDEARAVSVPMPVDANGSFATSLRRLKSFAPVGDGYSQRN